MHLLPERSQDYPAESPEQHFVPAEFKFVVCSVELEGIQATHLRKPSKIESRQERPPIDDFRSFVESWFGPETGFALVEIDCTGC